MTDGSAKKRTAGKSGIEMQKKIRLLEEALDRQKRNEAKLRALMESSSDFIVVIDVEGRYHEVVTTNEKKLYLPVNQALGKNIRDIFPKEKAELFMTHIQKVIKTGKTETLEYTLPLGGEKRWFECRTSPLIEKDKPVEFSVSVIHDITERMKMDAELLKSKNLESIGVLAGGIAHDFNNLLAIILGNVTVAKLSPKLDTRVKGHLEKAENAIEQAKVLTGQLLTFSKGGAPLYKTVSIAKILKNITGHALSGTDVKCLYSFDKGLWPVHVDETQLSIALRHIVTNAVEAMPGGGLIKISAANIDTSNIGSLPLELRKYVKITVEDEGSGMPEEVLKNIFDPYFTTKKAGKSKGKGLGLSITYSIIRKHGGYIEARSKIDAGTCFEFYLPAVEPVAPEEEVDTAPIMPTGREKKILVMDDEHFLREITKEMVKALGYRCEAAVNGEMTVKKYKEAMEKKDPFDVVIVDLTNKEGMGGKETIKKLRKVDPEVHAVISSGYCYDDVLENPQTHGFKAVLSKPYTMKELKQALDS